MPKITMNIPNVKVKNGRYYFRIVVPTALRQYFGYKTEIIQSLKTTNPATAAKLAYPIAVEYKRQFSNLRNGSGLNIEAEKLLREYKLKPLSLNLQPEAKTPSKQAQAAGIDDSRYAEFIDGLGDELSNPASGTGYDEWDVADRAFDILHDKAPITLTAAEERAVNGITERKRVNTIKCSFKLVRKVTKAENVTQINPVVLQDYIDTQTELATKTLQRYFNIVKRATKNLCRLYGREINNPFDKISYGKLKKVPAKRKTITPTEFTRIQHLIENKWHLDSVKLIALLINTGCRIAEIAGLEKEHVCLSAEQPYLIIVPTEQRGLKLASTARYVPLFGISLQAAAKLAQSTERFLFPRYNQTNRVSNDNASAAVNKWLKANLPETKVTSHSFRHTTNTRLAEAGIDEPLREKWHGWVSQNMAAYYGEIDVLPLYKKAVAKLCEYERSEEARYKQL